MGLVYDPKLRKSSSSGSGRLRGRFGSYNKPIPKKLKFFERLRQQNASEFQHLLNEIHLLRAEQRRMSHDTTSQTNASVRTYSSYVPKRQVPAEIFTAFRNVNRILVKDLYMQRT